MTDQPDWDKVVMSPGGPPNCARCGKPTDLPRDDWKLLICSACLHETSQRPTLR